MKSICLETDPLLLLSREKTYNLHKDRIATAEKTIDNSIPNTYRLPRFRSKSPMKIFELDQSNSRIYTRLNEIYHRPKKLIKTIVNIKSTTNINRSFKNSKISTENEFIQKRLTSQKATLSFKELKKHFKESKEFKEMISKFNRMESSKKFINSYKIKAT